MHVPLQNRIFHLTVCSKQQIYVVQEEAYIYVQNNQISYFYNRLAFVYRMIQYCLGVLQKSDMAEKNGVRTACSVNMYTSVKRKLKLQFHIVD